MRDVPGRTAEDDASGPLIDEEVLEELGELLAHLVERALASAERLCERIRTRPLSSTEVAREAHSLRGASGSTGLARISKIAGEIEDAAQHGDDVEPLVGKLQGAIAATRVALRKRDLGEGHAP